MHNWTEYFSILLKNTQKAQKSCAQQNSRGFLSPPPPLLDPLNGGKTQPVKKKNKKLTKTCSGLSLCLVLN